MVHDSERLKVYFLEKLVQAGTDILFHSTVGEVEQENGRIKSVIVFGNGSKLKINAKVFIDATGDGNIAVLAGAGYQTGGGADGLCEPVSLIFRIEGVDDEKTVYPTFGTHSEQEKR